MSVQVFLYININIYYLGITAFSVKWSASRWIVQTPRCNRGRFFPHTNNKFSYMAREEGESKIFPLNSGFRINDKFPSK